MGHFLRKETEGGLGGGHVFLHWDPSLGFSRQIL